MFRNLQRKEQQRRTESKRQIQTSATGCLYLFSEGSAEASIKFEKNT